MSFLIFRSLLGKGVAITGVDTKELHWLPQTNIPQRAQSEDALRMFTRLLLLEVTTDIRTDKWAKVIKESRIKPE